jgi:hypothetical protein
MIQGGVMTTIEDVYCKFGETAEAAQLLETQLGNMLFEIQAKEEDLFTLINIERATKLVGKINRHTLGQLLIQLGKSTDILNPLECELQHALSERNRLAHEFFREHNLRRNSDEGRTVMLCDLEKIHATLLSTYILLIRLCGINLEDIINEFQTPHGLELPSQHLQI